jgi:hypothetical protein
MWLRRLLLRVLVKAVILLGAMWLILRNAGGPVEMFFPPAFQHQLKSTLVLFIICALILVFWRAVRVILLHLRYRAKNPSSTA